MSNATVTANFTNSSVIANQTIPPPLNFKKPEFSNKFNFTGRGDDSGNGDDSPRREKQQIKYKNITIDVDNSNFKRNTPVAYNGERKGQIDEMIGA